MGCASSAERFASSRANLMLAKVFPPPVGTVKVNMPRPRCAASRHESEISLRILFTEVSAEKCERYRSSRSERILQPV